MRKSTERVANLEPPTLAREYLAPLRVQLFRVDAFDDLPCGSYLFQEITINNKGYGSEGWGSPRPVEPARGTCQAKVGKALTKAILHDDRFFLFGFGYPYYGYPYDYYPYDYGYSDYYGAPYNDQYWSDLTAAVQTELARAGYYHGAIDGAVSSDTVRAIRAYRKARGLPVSSQIDRRLLRSLDI
jgi:Putative peptidoglycan binding domain